MAQTLKHPFGEQAAGFGLDTLEVRTLSEALDRAAGTFGTKPALTTILPNGAQTTITYAELKAHAEAFAVYLREKLGLAAGETVAIMSPNCIGFCVASLGIAKAGCVGTNVNPLYTPAELEHQLTHSKAKAIVIIDVFGDKLDEVIAQTQVRHVVTLSVADFFPTLKKTLLKFVLKRVRKVIPAMTTAATPMAEALAAGRAQMASSDIAAYTRDTTGDTPALLQYTSGTTGRSKGAVLSHQAILANAEQGRLMTVGTLRDGEEVALVALPLYHITAFSLIFVSGMSVGAHGILVPSPRPPSNLKAAFEAYRITWFTGINTLFAALMAEPWFDRALFADIRFCGSGGAAQQTGVAQKWQEMTGVEILQGYGMTEVSGILTFNPPGANRLGKVGVPAPGSDIRIVDDAGKDVAAGEPGEVIGRSPGMMDSYLDNPEATAEVMQDGWYHSGDIGVMDADGYLEIVDRKKDMILVSGFNVSPNEIEDAISTVAGVVQVGVIGIEDAKTAEAPAAFVVRADESVTEEQILEACRARLTNYKVPKVIRFVDEVPVTLSGKVLRRQLRDEYVA
ncbi:AMP-binding protein [Sulfitobacter sp. S190]|uniref:AMP-binding protein n=1 Tax=Sulfitobacter sp. S190 TaxID=2867022 RepID=UPI0021A654ED|nr:AMP-binding protein [Sulfitobacter sp. S190]UWR21757.1 AMP-binding protein [Sulfitobacter sp. S190]